MLFYLKKRPAFELAVVALLGGLGLAAIALLEIPARLHVDARSTIVGAIGSLVLALWTIGVRAGYAFFCGRDYAERLTIALASHFADASALQMIGGLAAAGAEEIFFRGFIQGRFGIVAGAVTFMAAHIGARDIRVVGYWSIVQGFVLGALYAWSGNLWVPMLAHGLFDMGAMAYFRLLLLGEGGRRAVAT